jgi:hypothetical protein
MSRVPLAAIGGTLNMRCRGLVIQFRLMYRLADRFRSRGSSIAAASSFKKWRIDAGFARRR